MGVAKKLLYTDGITEETVTNSLRESKKLNKNSADLYGVSGKRLASALKTSKGNVIYVSVGHRIDLDTCVEIVQKCLIPSRNLPEPVWQADDLSREFLNLNYDHL